MNVSRIGFHEISVTILVTSKLRFAQGVVLRIDIQVGEALISK